METLCPDFLFCFVSELHTVFSDNNIYSTFKLYVLMLSPFSLTFEYYLTITLFYKDLALGVTYLFYCFTAFITHDFQCLI